MSNKAYIDESARGGFEQRAREQRAKALLEALRAMPPAERQQAIDDALAELAEKERRRELMAKVEALSTDELARRLA